MQKITNWLLGVALLLPVNGLEGQFVVLGEPAEPQAYMLHFRSGGYFCGASLIAEEWAVTAGHCINTNDVTEEALSDAAGTSFIVSGEYNLHEVEGTERRVNIRKIYLFGYTGRCCLKDVALLHLSERIEDMEPIKLSDEPKVGQEIKFYGWGNQDTDYDPRLQVGSATVSHLDVSAQGQFCTNSGSWAGRGDSGGPAVNEDGELIGIISRSTTAHITIVKQGSVCFEPVSNYRAQIEEVIASQIITDTEPVEGKIFLPLIRGI